MQAIHKAIIRMQIYIRSEGCVSYEMFRRNGTLVYSRADETRKDRDNGRDTTRKNAGRTCGLLLKVEIVRTEIPEVPQHSLRAVMMRQHRIWL